MSMTRHNQAEATDIAQEAFIRAYRKLRGYKPQYAFRNWVMTIGANLAKNRFRGTVRRQQVEESYLEMNPGRTYRTDPRHIAVRDALKGLRESYRTPLTLRHMEGLSYEEIAQVLGIGVSAAKMRVKRGTDELKAQLNPPWEAQTT